MTRTRYLTRHLRRALPGCAAIALALAGSPGAGADEWLTVRASALYLTQAQQEARAAHRDRIARSAGSCEERRQQALAQLDDPSSRALRNLAQRCASAGLVMRRELRCRDGRLQVRCGGEE